MPHSQPTALQQTVCKFHLDPQYHIFHWGSTILGDSTRCQTKIHVSSLLLSWVIQIFYLPENIFDWDIVTGANSSNDMLILCQNVEINSNKYFCTTHSCYCYFRNETVDHMAYKSHLWEEGNSCPVYLLFGDVYWSRWSRVCRRLTSLLFYIRIEYFTYLTWHTTVDNMHFETVLKLENISPK